MNSAWDVESVFELGRNHVEKMVDTNGQPYFNVFAATDEKKAAAVHDWPDFGDLTARYLESAILIRHVTGKTVKTEPIIRKFFFSLFDEDGLTYRPLTSYSKHLAEMFDQGRTLTTLATLLQDEDAPLVKQIAIKMIKRLFSLANRQGKKLSFDGIFYDGNKWSGQSLRDDVYYIGGLIQPLVLIYRLLNFPEAMELACGLIETILSDERNYTNEGRFSGHMHSRLGTAAGIASAGQIVNRKDWLEISDKIYQYAKTVSTDFGYVPERVYTNEEIYFCETCAIMDFINLAIVLAGVGHTEYYSDIERIARNQLFENQICRSDWLSGGKENVEDDIETTKDVGTRLIGGFAGMAGPYSILSCACRFSKEWISLHGYPDPKRYLSRYRVIQNCCSPAGLKAFYLIWQSSIIEGQNLLTINYLFDKYIHGIRIIGYEPYLGRVDIKLSRDTNLRIRKPENIKIEELRCFCNKHQIFPQVKDGFLEFECSGQDILSIHYPLKEKKVKTVLRNPGCEGIEYNVWWRGSTVIELNPVPGNERFCEVYCAGIPDALPIKTYYGKTGVSYPLYQRREKIEERTLTETSKNFPD